ncbi:MAG: hypothetical protein RBS13_01940 [Bacteroidales bacterium]|nr:hypothetical protein [Bacteroidales bacterium]
MRKTIYYYIAHHVFAVESEKMDCFLEQFKSGMPFLNATPIIDEILFTISLDETLPDWGMASLPEWEINDLCRFDYEQSSCMFSRYKKGYLFRMDFLNGKEPLLMMKDNQISCFHINYSMQKHINIIDFKFALWVAYGIATAPLHTVAMHASTIVYRQQAILFLGESGTGKSTQSRLWIENIPKTRLLNDDSPIVRIINNIPIVFGSIWSGKKACYLDENYKIAAIVRVRQAKANAIKRLHTLDSFAALYPSCPPMFAYDSILSDYIHTIITTIIEQTPVFMLDCLPDDESARLTYATIFKKIT